MANLTQPLKIRWRKIRNPYKQKEYKNRPKHVQVFNINIKTELYPSLYLNKKNKKFTLRFKILRFFFLIFVEKVHLFLNSNNNKSFLCDWDFKESGVFPNIFLFLRNVLSYSLDVLSPSLFLCKFLWWEEICFLLFWVKA